MCHFPATHGPNCKSAQVNFVLIYASCHQNQEIMCTMVWFYFTVFYAQWLFLISLFTSGISGDVYNFCSNLSDFYPRVIAVFLKLLKFNLPEQNKTNGLMRRVKKRPFILLITWPPLPSFVYPPSNSAPARRAAAHRSPPCDTDGRCKRWGRPERVCQCRRFITPDPGHPGAELHRTSDALDIRSLNTVVLLWLRLLRRLI